MEVISIYARLDGGSQCPYCGDIYGERGFCQTCHGCVLCCWSDIHCFTCDLPGILCECVSCDEDGVESVNDARRKETRGPVKKQNDHA
jgi:hypothetical protein